MLKRSVLPILALIAFLASASTVQALQAPTVYYVDTAYTGSEDGTQERPYNTVTEADRFGRSEPNGAVIMVKKNGTYVYDHFVSPVKPGPTGIPLAGPVLYGLLAVLSLLLILGGWLFGRRSRQLQHST